MKHTLKQISSLMLVILISGCSVLTQSIPNSSTPLRVNATEVGKYWLVKNGTLDWSALLQNNNHKSSFTATFTINTDGHIEHLHLKRITGEFKIDEQMYVDFSKQIFIATRANHRR